MMRSLIGFSLAIALSACGGDAANRGTSGPTLTEALGGEAGPGFARATAVREFRFPFDHGPHRQYRNEWWYVTGNLRDEAGNRHGFQLTFFRIGLAPGRADRASRWGTTQIWMAHFALVDVAGDRFISHERFSRAGKIGMAGATRDPVRVWLENWELSRISAGRWRLQASAGNTSLELMLGSRKAPILHGQNGLSRKSSATGDASYYYSLTRLAADGTLQLDGQAQRVNGTAWLDREWSTSALSPGQRGWDWFALQLDDGTDVMIYRLRRDEDRTDPHSAGMVVEPDGHTRRLDAGDFRVEVLDRWTSPRGGRYPSRWRLHIEDMDRTMLIAPVREDQELDAIVRYWEGAVDVRDDEGTAGVGYVELTGYAAAREQP